MKRDIRSLKMSFVNGGSDILRVLAKEEDNAHYITDLETGQLARQWNDITERLEDKLKVIRREIVSERGYGDESSRSAFSEDGNTLLLSLTGRGCTKVFRYADDSLLQREIYNKNLTKPLYSDGMYTYAGSMYLSPNGQSIWGYCARDEYIHPSEETEKFIALWPQLSFDEDTAFKRVIIEGDRAIWTTSEEYLAIWKDRGERPLLNVYEMEDLRNDKISPIATKTLQQGLVKWEAIGRRSPHRSLLIREISKSGKERYVEWDFENDIVVNEIFMDRQTGVWSHQRHGCYLFCLEVRQGNSEMLNGYEEDPFPSFRDGMHWIGSLCADGSFSVASCSSGATIFKYKAPRLFGFNWNRTKTTFDDAKGQILVIGTDRICVFAPAFLQHRRCCHDSSFQITEDAVRDDTGGFMLKAAFELGSHALARVLDRIRSVKGWDDDDFRLLHRVAFSSNGCWCACIKKASTDWLERAKYGESAEYGGCILPWNLLDGFDSLKRPQSYWKCKATEHHTVFVFPCNEESDYVVFMSICDKPELFMFDVNCDGQKGDVVDVPLWTDGCLHVHQTGDQKSLVMLERAAVSIWNPYAMAVQERIPYETDFGELVERRFGMIGYSHDWWADRSDRRVVSDDGRTVLLGWDDRARRSILVTPTTEQHRCEAVLDEAGDGFHIEACQLTRDGSCTLFLDMDEVSKGRLVIGIYSNRDERMLNSICVAEGVSNVGAQKAMGISNSNLFYEMSWNASEMLVLTVPNEYLERDCDVHFKLEIRRYSIYDTEECISGYGRLMHFYKGTTTEKVQRMFDKFKSGHMFNYPGPEGMSIFQEAFIKGKQEMVQSIKALAQRESFELASSHFREDLLFESINKKAVGRVEEAIDLITSDQCPIKDRLSVTSEDISGALQLTPQRVTKALLKDEFVMELCQIPVHTDFLNPVIRRDSAVHVEMYNEVLNWKLDDDVELLAYIWRESHSETVYEMEKDGNESKVTASLKVVCIDGAGRPGSLGLIRHLLLNGVPEDVFKSKAIKWIVSWKWFKIWRPKFIRRGLLHLAFLVCLTVYTVLLGMSSDLANEDVTVTVSATVFLLTVVVYGILMAIEEKRELTSLMNERKNIRRGKRRGVCYYSKWNWVDTISCIMLVVLIPLFHILSLFISECNPVLSVMVAIEVILAYIKVWYYVQPFRVTGALVLMVENIVRDCLAFLGMVLNMVLGFALAIHVMLRRIIHAHKDPPEAELAGNSRNMYGIDNSNQGNSGPKTEDASSDNPVYQEVGEAFGTFIKSVLTLFYALFGEFDSEVYTVEHELKWIVLPTFVIYMIAQIIVLLNLLISIMGDTFDRVKSNEEGQMLMARAMIIDSCEASATEKEMEEIECFLFPMFLYLAVLLRKLTGKYICAVESIEGQSDETVYGWWTGKFNMLVERIKYSHARIFLIDKLMLRDVVTKSKDHTEGIVKDEVKVIRDDVNAVRNEVKDLKASTQQQEQRTAAIGDRLDQQATEQAEAISSLHSAIADVKQQTELRVQDLSTKIDRIISILETQEGA